MSTYIMRTRLRAKAAEPSTSSKMEASLVTKYEHRPPSLSTRSSGFASAPPLKSGVCPTTPGRSRFTAMENSLTLFTTGVAVRQSSFPRPMGMFFAR